MFDIGASEFCDGETDALILDLTAKAILRDVVTSIR